MDGLLRSLIFVPGNNKRFLEKARTLDADIVCLDLEDSVPADQKDAARSAVREALKNSSKYSASVYVRTNSPASGMIPDDLEETIRDGIDGIVIPKVDSARQIAELEGLLDTLESGRGLSGIGIMPSIESAAGVLNCYEISKSSDRVRAVVFGVFDLLNDLGIEYTKGAPGSVHARSKIPLDARAAGVCAIDAIWQDIEDYDGLRRDAEDARSLGYCGKCVIHPGQIGAVHDAFRPTAPQLEWARRVVDAYLESSGQGRGATAVDGKMIDEVHYKQARALLDI